ncbi:MAG TPA: VanZ family protein [Desulfobulbaceae bacterium]|nr:VanZ family protein [Desulfobulbaceae bacterium]HHD62845.1 VanZ family protein [Desulfobulbaceae bacterium]
MRSRGCWFRFIPMILVMGIIFFLSNQPGDTLPLPDVPNLDKLLHAGIYSLLAATTLFAVQNESTLKKPRLSGFFVLLFCLLYGISDEWHQSFVPGRTPSIWDIAADTTGAVCMVFFWFRFSVFRKFALKIDKTG